MLKVVCLVERSVNTNLVEIHEEMSELLDKEVYVLNECLKYKFRDSCRGITQAQEKCAMKIKERKK